LEKKPKNDTGKNIIITKRQWKNNYNGKEELGSINDSNKFTPDDFYG
jgi:hypothetical protein